MCKRSDIDYLFDIRESIGRIRSFVKKTTYRKYQDDVMVQDAIIRNMEIIGEASKNITDDFKKKQLQIPWKNLAGVRDKLIHDYFGVDLEIIWDIAKKELPILLPKINEILKKK